MAYLPNQGKNPQGETVIIPVGGMAWKTTTPLAANASVNTGWLNNQNSLLYVIRSDQPSATGGVVIEFSDDGVNPLAAGANISYTQTGQQIQRVLAPKGSYTRLTYTNGSTAQTSFRLEVRTSPTLIQPTEGSMNVPVTDTSMGMYVVADEQLSDGTTYDRIGRVNDAKKVHVVNQQSATNSLTDTQLRATPVSVNQTQPTNATVTTVTTLATVTTVLAANPNRKGASFFSVTGTIFIKEGTGASTTNFTGRVVTNGMYELQKPAYTGVITAIGAGTLNVTEEF